MKCLQSILRNKCKIYCPCFKIRLPHQLSTNCLMDPTWFISEVQTKLHLDEIHSTAIFMFRVYVHIHVIRHSLKVCLCPRLCCSDRYFFLFYTKGLWWTIFHFDLKHYSTHRNILYFNCWPDKKNLTALSSYNASQTSFKNINQDSKWNKCLL